MAIEKTNTDIPGDTTPQPKYMSLAHAQKDLVDRAIYGQIIHGNDFSADELSKAKNDGGSLGIFMRPQPSTSNAPARPRSDQVEQEIEKLREGYASKLLQHDTTTQTELTHLAASAPAAAESRRALNAIIQFNGDECGCSKSQDITQPIIANIIHTAKTGQSR